MNVTSEIEKIKNIIVNTIPIEKLYLFGSYAYGAPSENSDYDFYAVIPNNTIRPTEAIFEIYKATGRIERKPMDILAGTAEVFERRSKLLTMEREICEKGVVLYDRQQH